MMEQDMNGPGDLDWLARRHLLGELDETEAASFAALLGEDDEAVAALERADRLLAALEAVRTERSVAIAAGPRGFPSAGSRVDRWRLGVGVAGLAAAVAIAVIVLGPATGRFSFDTSRHTADLLALWRINADRGSDEAAWDDSELAEESPDAPPEWLLAAVTLEAGPRAARYPEPLYPERSYSERSYPEPSFPDRGYGAEGEPADAIETKN